MADSVPTSSDAELAARMQDEEDSFQDMGRGGGVFAHGSRGAASRPLVHVGLLIKIDPKDFDDTDLS